MHGSTIDMRQLWENVLVDVELSVSRANFTTWFKDTHISKIEEGIVYVGVPNHFVREWLCAKYHKLILKSLRTLEDSVRSVEYIISRGAPKKTEVEAEKARAFSPELPLAEYYVHKESNLNPRYVFDTFVVGGFNELAHAAAQAVIRKPGVAYNPLFVYGDTGLGKTHLIQAIGNFIKVSAPEKKIYYITSEKFYLDNVNAVQANKVNIFKEKYRHYDVLVMDDIQFLAKKEKTQEELFHIFNALYDSNKQIVFSSDQHPSFIPNLEDRLKSRFAAGMIVAITQPDHESRVAILRTKAKMSNFLVADDVMEYLATTVEGNVRELEGILNQIIVQTQLKERILDLQDIKNLVKNPIKPKKAVSVKEVIKTIADYYDVEEDSIYQKTRRKEVVKPRQLIMYILREDFHISYPTIGEKLGGRDHTTVIHSCEKIKTEVKSDSLLAQEITQIRTLLK